MKSHLCLVILALISFQLSSAWAQEENSDAVQAMENTPLVEVQIPADFREDYKERRENHGWMFGINYETYKPSNYISVLDNTTTYGDMFGGEAIQMVEGEVDYKMNFAAGSIAVGAGYGGGQVTGTGVDGLDHKVDLSKTFVTASYIMDTLFPEPYVAPYLKGQVFRFGINETNPTDSFSADSAEGMAYTLGFLLQLDALDPEGSRSSVVNWGLQNTYIDVFVTKYMKTQAENDPDTENDWDYGAGLRLEF